MHFSLLGVWMCTPMFLVSIMVRSGDTLITKVKSGGKVTASLQSIGFFLLGARTCPSFFDTGHRQTNNQLTEATTCCIFLFLFYSLFVISQGSRQNNKTFVKKLWFGVFSCCYFYGALFTRSFYRFAKYIFIYIYDILFYLAGIYVLCLAMRSGWMNLTLNFEPCLAGKIS